MRALKNRLILKADMEQKSVIKYGSLTLFMPPKHMELTTDAKITNPVLAEVIGEDAEYPHIKNGDILILQHNSLVNPAMQIMGGEGSIKMFVIPRDKEVLGKLGKDGELIPLCENVLCERIYENDASSIIFTPDAYKKTEENRVKILAVSPEAEHLEVGKIGICFKYSDYEITYNLNGQSRTAIVVWKNDFVGTL